MSSPYTRPTSLPRQTPPSASFPPPAGDPVDYRAPDSFPAPKKPKGNDSPPGRNRLLPAIAAGAVAGLLAGLGGAAAGVALFNGAANSETQPSLEVAQQDVPAIPETNSNADGSTAAKSVSDIAKQSLPGVVAVSIFDAGNQPIGTGSGFIWDSNGVIVTNNHVVADAANGGTIRVQFSNGKEVEATLAGRSKSYDLAVLSVSEENLPDLPRLEKSKPHIGEPVVAIGSPLGLDGTVTTGIISSLNRPVIAGPDANNASYISALQTDAAINPGNSGGPLLDSRGRVVGVNSAIATLNNGQQSGSIGLGFAIPINQADRIVKEILATGESAVPVIGVTMDEASSTPRIRQIETGGPAEKAGLKAGDTVVKVGDTRVASTADMIVAIRSHNPGDTITLTTSNGTTANVTLDSVKDL